MEHLRKSQEILPRIIIAVYFCIALLRLIAPTPEAVERLWLEWLGNHILQFGIPHQLGPEALLSAGSRWVPQEWLFALILAWCAQYKLDLLPIIIMACLTTVPLIVTYVRMRNMHADQSGIIFALLWLGTVINANHIEMRASAAALAAISLAFAAISCNDRRQFFLPIIVLLLVNIHASSLYIAVLPSVALISNLIVHRSFRITEQRLLIVSIACFLASLTSPFGFSLYEYACSLGAGSIHHYISEWTPSLRDLARTDVFLLEAVLSAGLLWAWKHKTLLTPSDVCTVLTSAAMMLYAQRFIPLFFIATLPFALKNGMRIELLPMRILEKSRVLNIIVLISVAPWIFEAMHNTIRYQHTTIANRPGLFFASSWFEAARIGVPSKERVYCTQFAECNAFLWLGASTILDGRCDPFPTSIWLKTITINNGSSGWEKTLNELHVNVLVIEKDHKKLDKDIRNIPQWKKIGETSTDDIFLFREPQGLRDNPSD